MKKHILLDYLDNRLNDEDRRRVEEKIRTDPEWKHDLDAIRGATEWLSSHSSDVGASSLYWSGFNSRMRQRVAGRLVRKPARRWVPALAATAVVVLLAVWWWPLDPAAPVVDGANVESWEDLIVG